MAWNNLVRQWAESPARMAATGALVLLAGCVNLAPPVPQPALPVADAWPQDAAAAKVASDRVGDPAASVPWRRYFTDATQVALIEQALQHNRDLRLAVMRVEEARALYGIRRADRLPTVGLDAQAARSRVPGDLSMTGQPAIGAEYRASVGFSGWELDLWGRVRNLEEAALQAYLASEDAGHAVRLALIAEVAEAYLSLRELDARVATARQTIASREASVRIFRSRHAAGAASRLELTQVETLLHQAQALGAQLAQARAAQAHALALLVGKPVDLPAGQDAAAALDAFRFPALAGSLPSDLLTDRPDIMAAEHQLRAANANIGAARAVFFPRIALTVSGGTASAALNGLFDAGSGAWTFAPVVSLPIFDAGARRGNLTLSQIRRDMAVMEYDKAIQTAFRDVADALSAQHWLAQQLDIQRAALASQTERARLAQLRYDNGAVTYLEVLDAQRALLDTQQQLIQAQGRLLSSQIALYAALGGGSHEAPAPSAHSIEPKTSQDPT